MRPRIIVSGGGFFANAVSKSYADLIGSGIYGNKADGNITYNSGTTALTGPVFADVITMASGAVVDTAGFPVRCHTLIMADNTCYMGEKPLLASVTTGPYRASTAGSAGGAGAGTAGSSTGTYRIGGNSGAGGAGSGGAGGAAATGVLTVPHAQSTGVNDILWAAQGLIATSAGTTTMPYGGGGGGGGGGDGTAGGQGGSGGRHINIAAKTIIGNGILRADGGNGADAAAGDRGGGGGGGGGWLVVIYRQIIGSPTFQAAGGTGGAKTGTGVAGSAGSSGVVTQIIA